MSRSTVMENLETWKFYFYALKKKKCLKTLYQLEI